MTTIAGTGSPGFGGDGDAFSIGGNHFTHTARKNIKLTCVAMDNWVYGLTKKQTSPTSPLGFKSKTDIWGAVDYPINPMKQLVAMGATFIARSHSHLPNHVMEMFEAAMDHDGFSVIEVLSECTEFYPGAFDAAKSMTATPGIPSSTDHAVAAGRIPTRPITPPITAFIPISGL